jgi:hypothetical protein
LFYSLFLEIEMNTARIYRDIDNNPLTIHEMVRCEPQWAANRIQRAEHYEHLLKLWYEQQADRIDREGNAPGHSHPIPGVWDTDNGNISGHRCAECALFSLAELLSKMN